MPEGSMPWATSFAFISASLMALISSPDSLTTTGCGSPAGAKMACQDTIENLGRASASAGASGRVDEMSSSQEQLMPPQAANFALASRFKLTPCSAAVKARLR
jgi:hypothetical protein